MEAGFGGDCAIAPHGRVAMARPIEDPVEAARYTAQVRELVLTWAQPFIAFSEGVSWLSENCCGRSALWNWAHDPNFR